MPLHYDVQVCGFVSDWVGAMEPVNVKVMV